MSVADGLAVVARVAGAEADAGLLFDHDPLGVAHVARLVYEAVALLFERPEGVGAQAEGLVGYLVGQPLVVYARRVDGLLDVHVEVYDVGDDLHDRVDDGRAAWRADGEPERAVLSHDEGRRHRRERSLARRDCVALALNQPVRVRRSGLRREVVHLVVHEDARPSHHDLRAVAVVQSVSVRHAVARRVDDREVRRLFGLRAGGPPRANLRARRG